MNSEAMWAELAVLPMTGEGENFDADGDEHPLAAPAGLEVPEAAGEPSPGAPPTPTREGAVLPSSGRPLV
jgi:hypothetical protein